MIYKLELGDQYNEGHRMSEVFLFDCNYDVHKIRQAYKDSCKKLGVAFNYNEDYTGLGLGYGDDRRIWTTYEEASMGRTAFEILDNAGCLKDIEWHQVGCDYYINEIQDCAKLIMNFIALSMPEDFRYKSVKEPQIESINCWNDELDEEFGYGLFYE